MFDSMENSITATVSIAVSDFDGGRIGLLDADYDWVIVGAGFSGAVLAERLADRGDRVLVVDRRPHVAGNAFDCRDAAGILIHQYGPHIFHTNAQIVVDYLSRFTSWRPYEHRVLASVRGRNCRSRSIWIPSTGCSSST